MRKRPIPRRGPSPSPVASKIQADLLNAFALHQRGQLVVAEQIYRNILKVAPHHFDATHLLGVVLLQRDKLIEAEQLIGRALKINPNDPSAHNNYGNSLRRLKRIEDALKSFNKAIALKPDYVEALSNRGEALHELKRFGEALRDHERALRLRPDYVEAHYNRGNTLYELKRFEEALASYDRVITLRPNYAEAFCNRGVTLRELKRFDEAITNYDHALMLRPTYAEALYNRGLTLHEVQRFEEALESYERAIALKPDYRDAFNNRGTTLMELKHFDEALASFDCAIRVQPQYADALYNRGVALSDLKQFEQALASYDSALILRPDDAKAHYNEALCRLTVGDFDRGWKKYEWRWEKWRWENGPEGDRTRKFEQPLWTGSDDITGKTILLHAEQGYGDTIQFCRYVPFVVGRAGRVILEVQPSLRELMGSLGTAQVVSKGDPLPEFDIQCPLLSLPLAFGTKLETIPSTTPYLCVPSQALGKWTTRFGPRELPAIGLVWSGNPIHKNDANRSISLRTLLPLLNGGARFVSLQKDVRSDDSALLKERKDLPHFDEELQDFSDTAAVISNLDLVISVDTSVAHLAGALGKPVWVLLPYIPDWRWLLDRGDSPWYLTARLFRQDATRGWDNVIVRVHAALEEFVRGWRRATIDTKPSELP
jgi:tetratricopeptide (TPR) repeat protein